MTQNILTQQVQEFGIALHERILESLVNDIRNAIEDGRIRSQDGQHSVYDFIRTILSGSNPSVIYTRLTASVPAVLTICYDWQFPGERQRKTPVTNLAGLIYIAYIGSSDFSCSLRASSAALLSQDWKQQPKSIATPPESAIEPEVKEVLQLCDLYPFSLEYLHKASGIVNKHQVKVAVTRDFEEERDYIVFQDGHIRVSESVFHILMISFRSLQGADIEALPEVIPLATRAYFQWQKIKRMNTRVGKRDRACPGQMSIDSITVELPEHLRR